MQFRSGSLALMAAALVVACAGEAAAQFDDRFPFFARPEPAYRYPTPPYLVPARPPPAMAPPRVTVTPKPKSEGGRARSRGADGQMVCVRTCDGFFFPVSAGHNNDRSVAEFMCKASCPGAPVKLFTKRGDDIENAVGADRSLYRRLASALSFRKETSPACSCRRPSGAVTDGRVFDDPTLRAGDVIVAGGRALVFKGGSRPYDERDFTALEHSSLPASARQKVSAVLSVRSSAPVSLKREAGRRR
jgi:hypothetical protein